MLGVHEEAIRFSRCLLQTFTACSVGEAIFERCDEQVARELDYVFIRILAGH
jgi:hypothetical protein